MSKTQNISDEERERRRQNMLKLKQEGRVGPQFGKLGGRPRKPRASETIAEKVAQDAEEIYSRLIGLVREGAGRDSISSAQTLLKIEEQERKIVEFEEDKIDQLRRDELLAFVAGKFAELNSAGILTRPVIEGTVVRDGDERTPEFSEITDSAG